MPVYIPHDSSEDVDQDGLDLVVRVQQLEGLLHLDLRGAAAHIEEVGRVTALELYIRVYIERYSKLYMLMA